MRRFTLLFATLVLLLTPSVTLAAPTCLTKDGGTIKCGVEGAMPVGWQLSAERALARQQSFQPDFGPTELLELICILGVLAAFTAVLPKFDGRRDADWYRHEGDDERRR